ncbi:MAG TPA: twin-arginine translocation signal domain-containing protein, partial [Nannocystaceae bacterium]|nr:twin-arginine translocation signal domain-containing protein [Nannocystaceae bacterium]
MNRRDFLKFAAMSGLAVAAPRTAKAAFTPYTGPYYVMISARGGWDPVYFCDPKPKGEFNRKYDYDPAVHKVGAINYAPIPVSAAALGLAVEADPFLMSAQEFFTAHGGETVVINGINTETNNHDR